MIRKILKFFGFIHESELTEDYLCVRLAQYIGDPHEYEIDKEHELRFFRELSSLDGSTEYFKATMAKDMQRAFGAPDDQKKMIQGAYARTAYFRSKMRESNKPAPVESPKLTSKRYG
jgi:hypothetical protein